MQIRPAKSKIPISSYDNKYVIPISNLIFKIQGYSIDGWSNRHPPRSSLERQRRYIQHVYCPQSKSTHHHFHSSGESVVGQGCSSSSTSTAMATMGSSHPPQSMSTPEGATKTAITRSTRGSPTPATPPVIAVSTSSSRSKQPQQMAEAEQMWRPRNPRTTTTSRNSRCGFCILELMLAWKVYGVLDISVPAVLDPEAFIRHYILGN